MIQVLICGDHPHTGRVGTIEVIDGKVRTMSGWPLKKPHVLVSLGQHEDCLVAVGQMKPIDGKSLSPNPHEAR